MREYLTIDELKRFSCDKIRKLQEKRFRATLKHILPHSSFYREFFKQHKVDPNMINSVEDWKKFGLPLIKKKKYIENTRDFIIIPQGSHEQIFLSYFKFVMALNKREGIKLLGKAILAKISKKWNELLKKEVKSFFRPKMPAFAGGSESGAPTPVLLSGSEKLSNMINTADVSGYLIVTRHFDEDTPVTAMNLFPYAPHIAWQVINMSAEIRSDLNLCTAAGGFLNTEKLINIAKKAKPNVFPGMVDYLLNIFLPKAIEEGLKLDGTVVFLNGATKMLEIQRKEIKKLFKKLGAKKVIALDGYGASELKEATLAECEEGSGLHHVSPLSVIIKTVKINKADAESDYIYDWEFTNEEEGGYAALWNIDGAGTILQGYLLGDKYEKVVSGKCPHCGLNVQRVFNINRIADLETEMKIMGLDEEKVDGAVVNLSMLREKLLHLDDIKEAQLIVEKTDKGDKIHVKYVPKRGLTSKAKTDITDTFRKYSDVHPAIIEKVSLAHFYDDCKLKYNGIIRKNNHGIH